LHERFHFLVLAFEGYLGGIVRRILERPFDNVAELRLHLLNRARFIHLAQARWGGQRYRLRRHVLLMRALGALGQTVFLPAGMMIVLVVLGGIMMMEAALFVVTNEEEACIRRSTILALSVGAIALVLGRKEGVMTAM
jgi:hypothetical protein